MTDRQRQNRPQHYVSVSGELYRKLLEYADRHGVTTSSVVRVACASLLGPGDAGVLATRRKRSRPRGSSSE